MLSHGISLVSWIKYEVRLFCGIFVLSVLLDLNAWQSLDELLGCDEQCCVIPFPDHGTVGMLKILT